MDAERAGAGLRAVARSPAAEARVAGGRRRPRPPARRRRPTTSTSSSTATPRRRRARAGPRRGRRGVPAVRGFGAWRVVGRDRGWQVDLSRCAATASRRTSRCATSRSTRWPSRSRAERSIDPLGGRGGRRRRGACAWSAPAAFDDDPLRVLRLVRLAVRARPRGRARDRGAARARRAAACSAVAASASSPSCGGSWPRRLRAAGIELMDDVGAAAVVAARAARRCAGSSRAATTTSTCTGHTTRACSSAGRRRSSGRRRRRLGGHADGDVARRSSGEPLADELTRGEALRFGALLHDAAKPQTARTSDRAGASLHRPRRAGAELAREVLGRLRASERLRAHVAALTRHHLRLGFLVHERPLAAPQRVRLPARVRARRGRRDGPVGRRPASPRGGGGAERDRRPPRAGREMLGAALRWRPDRPPGPLVRGDELAAELGIPAGPAGRAAAGRGAVDEAVRRGEIAPARRIARARALGRARRPSRRMTASHSRTASPTVSKSTCPPCRSASGSWPGAWCRG